MVSATPRTRAASEWSMPSAKTRTTASFNFGGNFALFPTITADTFGAKNVGQNYPFVFLAYGVGGILGPILGGKMGDLGNFPLAFTISGIAVLLGTILTLLVKPASK